MQHTCAHLAVLRGLSVTFLSKLWDDVAPSEQMPKGTGKVGSARNRGKAARG